MTRHRQREHGPLLSLAHAGKPESAWQVAYGVLDLARLVSGAPHAALFACEGDALRLLALRGAEPYLEPLLCAWSRADTKLTRGHPHANRQPPFVALPCVDGVTVAGVLLLAWDSGFVGAGEAGALGPLGRVLGAILRRLGVAGGTIPSDIVRLPVTCARLETSALPLRAVLDEHEWNVARVARTLGVTRMTIYNRMAAAGLPRLRVPKSRPRKRGAPAMVASRKAAEAGGSVDSGVDREASEGLAASTATAAAPPTTADEE